MNQERQTFIHSVIDAAVIVRELVVAVRDTKLAKAPNQPARAVDQP